MKKYLLLSVAMIAVLTGCGSGDTAGTTGADGGKPAVASLKDKVVGTWKIDTESIKSKKITPEVMKTPQFAELKKAMESARLELKADGTYAGSNPTGEPSTGKWTVTDKTLKMTPDKEEKDKNPPTLTINDDGTRIHGVSTTPDDTMEMDFIKV